VKVILRCGMPLRFRRGKAKLQSRDEDWIEATFYVLPAAALDRPGFLEGAMPLGQRVERSLGAIEEWAQKQADRWERDHLSEAEGKVGYIDYWPVTWQIARKRIRHSKVDK